MSEEELIEKIQDEVELLNIDDRVLEISPKLQKELAKNIQGLLDIHNKEKEKNQELEATRNIGKTADETENEIEKIIQFMIEDNYNISFISSIRSLLALYKTYLSLYNKEKEKNKILELAKIPYLEGEIMAYKENDAVQRKMLNDAFDRGWIHKDKIKELQNNYVGQYLKFYEKIQELLEEE